jgi:hypothetical protein
MTGINLKGCTSCKQHNNLPRSLKVGHIQARNRCKLNIQVAALLADCSVQKAHLLLEKIVGRKLVDPNRLNCLHIQLRLHSATTIRVYSCDCLDE